MSTKNYMYYQPNEKDIKDKFGDCAIRAFCKAENMSWLDAYDIMYKISRTVQSPMNCKEGFEAIVKEFNYTYNGISNKKGSKRPTVREFASSHKEHTYILVCAKHYVCVKDGKYYDTWDCGNCCLYGYWERL